MSKTLTTYITALLNITDKALLVLSAASGDVPIASFAIVIGAPVGTTSTSFS